VEKVIPIHRMYEELATYQETDVIPDGEYVPWECRNDTRPVEHIKMVSLRASNR